jgi:hypothetical protein
MFDLQIIACWVSADLARSEALGLGCFHGVVVTLYHKAVVQKLRTGHDHKAPESGAESAQKEPGW